MMKRLKKAFTITELVIVIAVIAILAAVLIPTFTHVVENANQSAALQTCRNAMTEYLTMVTTDDKTDNDDATGAVFVYNDYAYVYVNAGLQYIGKLGDLSNIMSDKTCNSKNNGITLPSSAGDTITVKYTSSDSSEQSKTFTLADLAANDDHIAENLYFYSIEVNGTTYNGYFTYEVPVTNAEPELILNGAAYSRLAFIVATTITVE